MEEEEVDATEEGEEGRDHRIRVVAVVSAVGPSTAKVKTSPAVRNSR